MSNKFKANADTWIDQSNVGQQHGNGGSHTLNNGSNKKYALMHFAIPNLAGATVHSATLTVFLKGSDWAATNHIRADLLTKRFSEKETWHSYHADLPSIAAAADSGAIGTPHGDGHQVDITVTTLLQDAADDDAFRGFVLSTQATSNRPIYSSEARHKAYRPYITISYSLKPDAPTNLRPANYASAQKPLLAWDCDPQTEYYVQVATTGGSVLAESGWVVDEAQQADSSDATWDTPWTTSLPSNGDSRKWRVKFKDEVGTPSDYSEWSTWERRTLQSLTIDEPTSDGDTVLTTTPTIEWTFGGTETQWQIIIDDLDYDSGKIADNDTSFALPKGTITDRDTIFTMKLLVWDQYLRDAPGDASFVRAIRTFKYDGSGATTAPDSFTAETDGPAQVLTWHRAGAVDAFTIFADDEIIVDQIEGLVGSGGDVYTYRLLRTGREPVHAVAFSVAAHLDSTGDSVRSNSADGLSGPQGIWLVDEEEGVELEFAGKPEISLGITEEGSTYFPLGGRAPVRIVDQIRGYEGSVSAILNSVTDGSDREDAYRAFMQLKSIPPGSKGDDGKSVLRLIFGRYNIPVDIGEASVSQWPTAAGDNEFNVSFEFWQVDGPWPVEQ